MSTLISSLSSNSNIEFISYDEIEVDEYLTNNTNNSSISTIINPIDEIQFIPTISEYNHYYSSLIITLLLDLNIPLRNNRDDFSFFELLLSFQNISSVLKISPSSSSSSISSLTSSSSSSSTKIFEPYYITSMIKSSNKLLPRFYPLFFLTKEHFNNHSILMPFLRSGGTQLNIPFDEFCLSLFTKVQINEYYCEFLLSQLQKKYAIEESFLTRKKTTSTSASKSHELFLFTSAAPMLSTSYSSQHKVELHNPVCCLTCLFNWTLIMIKTIVCTKRIYFESIEKKDRALESFIQYQEGFSQFEMSLLLGYPLLSLFPTVHHDLLLHRIQHTLLKFPFFYDHYSLLCKYFNEQFDIIHHLKKVSSPSSSSSSSTTTSTSIRTKKTTKTKKRITKIYKSKLLLKIENKLADPKSKIIENSYLFVIFSCLKQIIIEKDLTNINDNDLIYTCAYLIGFKLDSKISNSHLYKLLCILSFPNEILNNNQQHHSSSSSTSSLNNNEKQKNQHQHQQQFKTLKKIFYNSNQFINSSNNDRIGKDKVYQIIILNKLLNKILYVF